MKGISMSAYVKSNDSPYSEHRTRYFSAFHFTPIGYTERCTTWNQYSKITNNLHALRSSHYIHTHSLVLRNFLSNRGHFNQNSIYLSIFPCFINTLATTPTKIWWHGQIVANTDVSNQIPTNLVRSRYGPSERPLLLLNKFEMYSYESDYWNLVDIVGLHSQQPIIMDEYVRIFEIKVMTLFNVSSQAELSTCSIITAPALVRPLAQERTRGGLEGLSRPYRPKIL